MIPITRLHRLAFRAATLANHELECLNLTTTTSSSSSMTDNASSSGSSSLSPQAQQSILDTLENADAANSPSLKDILSKLNDQEATATASETSSSSLLLLQNENKLQEATKIATFVSSLILQLYNLGVKDRTLWLQLKSLALRAAPFASSSSLVNMLECLSRKSVCGSLECKQFQLQLGKDISALAPQDILRFIAACQLCGTPLQQNVKEVISSQALRWIETNPSATCSMWWVLADVADQLPPTIRKAIVYNLVYAIEKIRTQKEEHALRQLWPQHDKDTPFILWRLRTNGNLSISRTQTIPNELNPSYSDALLKSIRVDKLPTARAAIFLLRALCLGVEDLSSMAKLVAEDVCRLIYNNVIEHRIQNHFLLRTIIESVAKEQMLQTTTVSNRSSNNTIPTAPKLGLEASLQYLRQHSYHITNETTCCILNILLSVQEKRTNTSTTSSDEKEENSTTEAQVRTRLQQSMRRLILVSSTEDLFKLMTLSHRVGILDYESAVFAFELMRTQHASHHDIQKASGILQELAEKHGKSEFGLEEMSGSSSSSSSSPIASLVSNWTEIRSLPAPKIAFYAASAAKQMYSSNEKSTTSCFLTNSAVVAPISNLISQSSLTSQQQLSSANLTGSSSTMPGSGGLAFNSFASEDASGGSSSSASDGGLFSLASAESEIVSHHKGLKALSAKDCATLVGASGVLSAESKSLVLRVQEAGSTSYLSARQKSRAALENYIDSKNRNMIELRDKKKNNDSNNQNEDNNEQNEEFNPIIHNPLFIELQSTVRFLEAQSSINTALELNSGGADQAMFTSAQRRLTRLFQMAHPPPFEYRENKIWSSWCGRLVVAIAHHRLATFRLPLWLMNVFCESYCELMIQKQQPFRAIRALHACCYFGIDNQQVILSLMKVFMEKNADVVLMNKSISPRGLLQILRSLSHVLQSEKEKNDFTEKAAKTAVETWLTEFTNKINEAKEHEKKKQESKKQANRMPTTAAATDSSTSSSSSSQQVVTALQNPNLYKGGFGSAANRTTSSQNTTNTRQFLTTFERRKLFDVLCCAATLDLPPLTYKQLIEHLHPFDTNLFPLADAMFFFGHAAQKKRLSGFSLRVWRSLTMQLDKVTLAPYSSSSSSSSNSSMISETLSSSSSSSSATSGNSSSNSLSTASSSSTGLPLIQTSMIVPPTLLSLAYYISYGGGSSSVDKLLEKLRQFGPFEPLILAKVIRIALAPAGVKTRPSLSLLICRSLDSTVVEAFSANDLVMLMEVFHLNQAQRVAVGLIQADSIVALAQEGLSLKMDQLCVLEEEIGTDNNSSKSLFMRAAAIPCSSSIHPSYVTKILCHVVNIVKKAEEKNNNNSDESSSIFAKNRQVWTPIIFQHVVSYIASVKTTTPKNKKKKSTEFDVKQPVTVLTEEDGAEVVSFANSSETAENAENDENGKEEVTEEHSKIVTEEWASEHPGEFWEQIKETLLEPLEPLLKGSDKEAISELLSL